MYTGMLLGKVG